MGSVKGDRGDVVEKEYKHIGKSSVGSREVLGRCLAKIRDAL